MNLVADFRCPKKRMRCFITQKRLNRSKNEFELFYFPCQRISIYAVIQNICHLLVLPGASIHALLHLLPDSPPCMYTCHSPEGAFPFTGRTLPYGSLTLTTLDRCLESRRYPTNGCLLNKSHLTKHGESDHLKINTTDKNMKSCCVMV